VGSEGIREESETLQLLERQNKINNSINLILWKFKEIIGKKGERVQKWLWTENSS
jgi:hypothetical protein